MSLNVTNLDKLIAHLEAQPPERINMSEVSVMYREGCGTCGCIIGHADLVWGTSYPAYSLDKYVFEGRARVGDLPAGTWEALVTPPDWDEEAPGGIRYPMLRVIATLKRLRDRFLATGEVVVDWGLEPTSEGQPWPVPQAIELKAPALPDEITRFLAAEPLTTGSER